MYLNIQINFSGHCGRDISRQGVFRLVSVQLPEWKQFFSRALPQNCKPLNIRYRVLNSHNPVQGESSDSMAHAFSVPIAYLEGVVRALERVRDKKERK